MEYKVIKPFDLAIKGDIFSNNRCEDLFEMTREIENSSSYCEISMTIEPKEIDKLVYEGYLVKLKVANDNDNNKLNKISDKVNELIDTYTKDYTALLTEYEKGGVQPCVKVEAETVYTNLIKVLNALKKEIDE